LNTRDLIVRYSLLCYKNGYVKATDGNLSIRTRENIVFITSNNTCKGTIKKSQIVKVDLKGNKIEGKYKPSSELKLHLYIYNKRPNVNAVIHTHPVFATAFASAGIALDKPVLPEIYLQTGGIPLAKYSTPSTDEVTNAISGLIKNHNAILLSNHGLVTFASTMEEAYYLTQKVEQFAQISFYARLLGGEKILTAHQLKKLDKLRNRK
jgi:L-fuculose-phosphate aldolase